jgi:hypothetical protein
MFTGTDDGDFLLGHAVLSGPPGKVSNRSLYQYAPSGRNQEGEFWG